MEKIFVILVILLSVASCLPQPKLNFPTEADMQKAEKKWKSQEAFINSEWRVVKDIEIGKEIAKVENKNILLYFTGYALIPARRIESELLVANKSILQSMRDDYINVWLYIDDQELGEQHASYQRDDFKSNVQPYFVIVDHAGKALSEGMEYNESKSNLESALKKYNKR